MELSNAGERFRLTGRQALYKNRLKTANDNLFDDMARWHEKLPAEGAIGHHVGQMGAFCNYVYDCLVTGNEQDHVVDDPVTFEALVIGILTSQWLLLRQVVQQHFPGLPYEAELKRLDRFAAERYFALYRALPGGASERMSVHPPLVHLGAISALSLVEGGLNIVNVPFGVVFDNQIQYAISHELGHIFVNSNEEILEEIKAALKEKLDAGTKRQKIIRRKIMDWLEEILADLIGVAMDGVDFATSGIWVMSSAESRSGITDKEHPESTIRPYIYDIALEALEEHLFAIVGSAALSANGGEDMREKIKGLRDKDLDFFKAELEKIKPRAARDTAESADNRAAEEETAALVRPDPPPDPLKEYYEKKVSFLGKLLDASGGKNLGNKLQSNENLFFPTLEEVMLEMEVIVKAILNTRPAALAGQSVLVFLQNIFQNVSNPIAWHDAAGYEKDIAGALEGLEVDKLAEKFNWGERASEGCGDLVLSLPSSLNLEHGTPSIYDDTHYICCRLNLGFCC